MFNPNSGGVGPSAGSTKMNGVTGHYGGGDLRELGHITGKDLKEVLCSEPVFKSFLNELGTPALCDGWLAEVATRISETAISAPKEHRGVLLTLGFPETYGLVGHVAIATVLRNSTGKLELGVLHQESIKQGDKWVGRIYDSFDSSAEFSGSAPPILKSLMSKGLPAVKIHSCTFPQHLKPLAGFLSGPGGVHPYGGDGVDASQDQPQLTCMSISECGMNAVLTDEFRMDTRPARFDISKTYLERTFGVQDYARLEKKVLAEAGFPENTLIASLEKKQQGKLFRLMAEHWIKVVGWDVSPYFSLQAPSQDKGCATNQLHTQ